MREMKDSGIEWIGYIPQDWAIAKLKRLCVIRTGSTPSKQLQDKYYTFESGVPWIKAEDLGYFKPIISTSEYLSTAGKVVGRVFPQNTVYVCCIASVGKVGFSKICCSCNQQINGITFNEKMYWKYGFYLTIAQEQIYDTYANGNVIKIINSEQQSNLQCIVPPLAEQQRIAEFLDGKCGEIDSLVADIQSQIDALEQYKRSVITETVTKGLNPDAEMKDSGIPWVGMIPEHWSVMPNKYLMHKVKEICPVYNNQDILSLTVNGVIVRNLDAGGKMPTSFDGYQHLHKGNLLMCLFDIDVTPRCIGLIQNSGLSSPAYSQFTLHDNAVAAYYYYYYLMVDYTKELLHMAKNLRHSLTEEQFGVISAPVPPLAEQRQIAKYLDEKITEINSIIDQKKEQLTVLDNYKKSLIYEYVTGKKEVPAQ